jgi:hypothetical protein
MVKVELLWSFRRREGSAIWVLASRKKIFAILSGAFTPRGQAYFVAEYYVAAGMPNKERGATLAETMALAEARYADFGYVEPGQWTGLAREIEGLSDKSGETELAEYRDE